jgi:GPI mannosyltransferase 2
MLQDLLERPVTWGKLVQIALLSRIFILVAMATSCWLFPNHNPGDDVLRFPLRFSERSQSCFCLQGQACDEIWKDRDTPIHTECANPETQRAPAVTAAVYEFLLTPLTRWDAARFLDLAVYPSRRDLPRPRQCGAHDCPQLLVQAEQAHAFFPLLPLVLRAVATALRQCVPAFLLPPTYEGVVALAALLVNLLCFVGASLALYDMTLSLTTQQLLTIPDRAERKLEPRLCQQVSLQVFLLFCINPASVFFTAAYSESLFACCNFGGHALLLLAMRQSPTKTSSYALSVAGTSASASASMWMWMTASYTRSNGSINSAWLVLLGVGWACHGASMGHYGKAIVGLLACLVGGMVVALPVAWHDAAGYQRLCQSESLVTPLWCTRTGSHAKSFFSLYGYVQRQHWNVGLFRYYTVKKIPNFILAAPILLLGICAVVEWIRTSFRHFRISQAPRARGNNVIVSTTHWAMSALGASVNFDGRVSSGDQDVKVVLLMGPLLLGHYAVLAATCLVGLTVAHVEISTRMICSTCPAIYWYMALCCNNGVPTAALGRAVVPYCLLYILLGVAMHPNWLPWT